jgi:hypothetical protein
VTAAELCVTQEGPPSLVWRLSPLDHVLGDTRLRQFKPELEKFAVEAWRSQSEFSMLIRRMSARNSYRLLGQFQHANFGSDIFLLLRHNVAPVQDRGAARARQSGERSRSPRRLIGPPVQPKLSD